jgi:hypothetical protein
LPTDKQPKKSLLLGRCQSGRDDGTFTPMQRGSIALRISTAGVTSIKSFRLS